MYSSAYLKMFPFLRSSSGDNESLDESEVVAPVVVRNDNNKSIRNKKKELLQQLMENVHVKSPEICNPLNSREKGTSQLSIRSLLSDDCETPVRRPSFIPAGRDSNKWVRENALDFLEDLDRIWGIICDVEGSKRRESEERDNISPDTICLPVGDTPEHVELVLTWIHQQLFCPQQRRLAADHTAEKGRLQREQQDIFLCLLRVYFIIATHYLKLLKTLAAADSLRDSFQRFETFATTFDILDEDELHGLQPLKAFPAHSSSSLDTLSLHSK